jgi:hypothetical protein
LIFSRRARRIRFIVTLLVASATWTCTPHSGPVMLATSATSVIAGMQSVSCRITNLGATALADFALTVKRDDGFTLFTITPTVPSGGTVSVGVPLAQGLRCEFRFMGLASDVRANMIVATPGGVPQVVFEAH